MSSAQAAIDRLCDPEFEVSAHYVIARDGQVTGLVPEDMRAWHAGVGQWCGLDDVNSRSIGVELDNDGHAPFAAPLMDALQVLLSGIMTRWGIEPRGVIGHSDLAPGRKVDPGPHFDWQRLERCGQAVPYGGGPVKKVSMAEFLRVARQAGYSADVPADVLLNAVRLRYRPWARGPVCGADISAVTPS